MVQRSEHSSRVLDLARKEADRFGHRYLGPEHLLLGILREGSSGAARVLEARGVALAAARAALGRLAERGLVPGPRASDAELLGSLGMDLDAIRRATEQARALGVDEVGPELLLWGVVTDIQTPWPRCMNNRWRRQLQASVGLPRGYRGAAGPLLTGLGVDLVELREAVAVGLAGVQP